MKSNIQRERTTDCTSMQVCDEPKMIVKEKIENAGATANLCSVNILGVRVHLVTMKKTLALLETMAKSGKSHHVVTVNTEFIMTAQQNELFREVLNNASLALPDGIGIVWAASLLGQPMAERVPGVDVVEQFSAVAQRHQLRVFFLGAAPGVAETVAQRMQEKYPGFIVAGTYSGSPHLNEEAEIYKRIEEAAPHALFVAYGSPQQDLWIARNLPRLKVPIAMGVGGTFDFIAGIAIRAPLWIRNMNLEWLHRVIYQPWRWRRALAHPRFALAVVWSRIKMHL